VSDLLHQLEAQLVETLGDVDGIGLVKPNEPLMLDQAKLPIVTLKWVGPATADYETGGGQDVTHTWRIYLYTKAREFEPTQEDLKLNAMKLLRALREDWTIGGLADMTKLRTETEPDIVTRGKQKIGQMTFLLSATGPDLL
jgi:hypothetical protein